MGGKRWLPLVTLFILIIGFSPGCLDEGEEREEGDDIRLFIAIHHEPGNRPKTTENPEMYWTALKELIESANSHGQRLTLLFNPQWAIYICQEPSRLALVRSWEAEGHEIGLHDHGPHLDQWSGYTDQTEFVTDLKYQGTISEMMAILEQVPASGEIRTACINDEDAPFDYPPNVLYDVDGGANGVQDLVRAPTPVTWNGHSMTMLKHARYSASQTGISVTFDDIDQAIEGFQDDQVIGIVFHTFEYDEDPQAFDLLFKHLEDNDVGSKSVSDLMNG